MRSPMAGFVAASLFVMLAACGAGSGSTIDTKAGPDGTPNASGDPSGPTGDSPGGIFGDLPLDSTDPPGGPSSGGSGACLSCNGSYACTTANPDGGVGNDPSTITLSKKGDGCLISGDEDEELKCDGDFIVVDKGTTSVVGSWRGSDSSFSVTIVVDGQTLTATCVPGSAPPQSNSDQGSSASGG